MYLSVDRPASYVATDREVHHGPLLLVLANPAPLRETDSVRCGDLRPLAMWAQVGWEGRQVLQIVAAPNGAAATRTGKLPVPAAAARALPWAQ